MRGRRLHLTVLITIHLDFMTLPSLLHKSIITAKFSPAVPSDILMGLGPVRARFCCLCAETEPEQ